MVSVGQGRRSGREEVRGGCMMATVQSSGNPGWEERRMDRWKRRKGKKVGEGVDKNGKKKSGTGRK